LRAQVHEGDLAHDPVVETPDRRQVELPGIDALHGLRLS
jgi:hypothetical protein